MPRQDLIRLRRGTAAEWAAANPVLRQGEPGLETDTGIVKVGDGVTAWASLLAVGAITTHDALYRWTADFEHNGTPIPMSATNPGVPRIGLAAGQRVKAVYEIPPGWETVAFRWGWTNESAGAGNVTWSLHYRLVRIGLETDLNTGAVTTIAVPAITAPGQFVLTYSNPALTAAIDLLPGSAPFGQFLLATLERTGGTLVGQAGVMVNTVTRV